MRVKASHSTHLYKFLEFHKTQTGMHAIKISGLRAFCVTQWIKMRHLRESLNCLELSSDQERKLNGYYSLAARIGQDMRDSGEINPDYFLCHTDF
ncbi:hypothetical protein SAMN05421644_15212 [Allochromatium warmingii]|uniref:Uncharacterized protein n=1 Tax=Allochromatium warmingii TaxID=61595 RepID=A0A1H3J6U0_ALLWA|nr:hypothetical protein SAMN05421644_15212 [Allochromatium warmingii]